MEEEVLEHILIEREAKQNYLITEIIQQNFDSDLFTWYISSLKEANVDIWTLNELQVIVNDFKSKYSPGQTLESLGNSLDNSIEAKQDYLRKEIIDQGFDADFFISYIEKIKPSELADWTFEELIIIVSQFKAEYNSDHIQISPVNKSGRNSLYGNDLEGYKVKEVIEKNIGFVDSESEFNSCEFGSVEMGKGRLCVKNEETFRSISPFPLHKTLSSDGNIVFVPIYFDESHSNEFENGEVGKEEKGGEEIKEGDKSEDRGKSEILEEFEKKFETKGENNGVGEGKKDYFLFDVTKGEEKAGYDDVGIGLTPAGPDSCETKTESFDLSQSPQECLKNSPKNAILEYKLDELKPDLSSPRQTFFESSDKFNAVISNQEEYKIIQIEPLTENSIYSSEQFEVNKYKKEEISIRKPDENEFLLMKKQEKSINLSEKIEGLLSSKDKIHENISDQNERTNSKILDKSSVHSSQNSLLNTQEIFDQDDPQLINPELNLPLEILPPEASNLEKNQEKFEEIEDYSQISIIQCQSIPFTELTFLSDINFTCGFPTIIKPGFFLKKYTEYQINIPILNTSVKRRYSDFSSLRSILLLTTPGSYIPPIPKKKVKNCFSANFIKKRQQMLNKFIATVLRDPNLRSSPYTLSFLKDPTIIFPKKNSKKLENFSSISSIEGETFCDFSKDSSLFQVFSDFLTISSNFENTLKLTTKNLIKSTKNLSLHIQEMGELIENLEEIQDFLPNNEKNSELFRCSKDCLVKWAAHEEINSNNFEADFKDFFEFRVKERNVMKELVDERNERLEKLNAVDKKKKWKEKNLSEYENVRNLFGYMNYKVKNEFDRVIGDQVIYDFEHFKMVCEKEADKCESLEALWMSAGDLFLLNDKFL